MLISAILMLLRDKFVLSALEQPAMCAVCAISAGVYHKMPNYNSTVYPSRYLLEMSPGARDTQSVCQCGDLGSYMVGGGGRDMKGKNESRINMK